MSDEIVVALIMSSSSLIGIIISTIWTNKKNKERAELSEKKNKERSDLTLYRIGELEKKQEKYNNLQERAFKEETKIAVMQEDIKTISDKIKYFHDA